MTNLIRELRNGEPIELYDGVDFIVYTMRNNVIYRNKEVSSLAELQAEILEENIDLF
jgi:hypothetical protein